MAHELPKPSLPGLRPPDLPTATPQPPTPPISDAPPPPEAAPAGPAAKVNVRVAEKTAEELAVPAGEVFPSINERVIATAIDFLVCAGLYLLVVIILPNFLAAPVALAYLVLRDSLPFLDGQSIGKKAMKLRAVTADDSATLSGNWVPGLIRNAVLAVPLFAIVELIVLLQREDGRDHGRRLGDEWAKTKVIVVKPPVEEDQEVEPPAA